MKRRDFSDAPGRRRRSALAPGRPRGRRAARSRARHYVRLADAGAGVAARRQEGRGRRVLLVRAARTATASSRCSRPGPSGCRPTSRSGACRWASPRATRSRQKLFYALEEMRPARRAAPQGVRGHPRAGPAPDKRGRHRRLHGRQRRRRRQVHRGLQARSAWRPRPTAPSSWPTPTRSTACRRSASRAASTRPARWPAATSARWR
ncbi:MAG: hypothetical protein MZW92_04490 [Comamonadaceae bacterium]|nr:hypothetical protein [Comamonadaceae bacterium]